LSTGETSYQDFDGELLRGVLSKLKSKNKTIIVGLPDLPYDAVDQFSDGARWHRVVTDCIRDACTDRAFVFSLATIQARTGFQNWFAPRYWNTAKLPCHPDATVLIAQEVLSLISRIQKPKVKAIAVDLDNTLWGGTIGEVGSGGLDLDPNGSGRPYLAMQRVLKEAILNGIPVAVFSKNEHQNAIQPFNNREEMILKLEDFLGFFASWEPKATAIKAFADKLNIDVSAVCFLDDSKSEREEAKALLPNLIVPELDEDPDARVKHLIDGKLFLHPHRTTDDTTRIDSYRTEFKRQDEKSKTLDIDSFLKSLQMELTAEGISDVNSHRVNNLLHKTNQFNLTMNRMNGHEITLREAEAGFYAHCFILEDKHGTSGIISAIIAELHENQTVQILEWVMSCRVFGRGVEMAALEHLSNWSLSKGASTIVGVHSITQKNTLLTENLLAMGFQHTGVPSDGTEDYSLTLPSQQKHHIRITG